MSCSPEYVCGAFHDNGHGGRLRGIPHHLRVSSHCTLEAWLVLALELFCHYLKL